MQMQVPPQLHAQLVKLITFGAACAGFGSAIVVVSVWTICNVAGIETGEGELAIESLHSAGC